MSIALALALLAAGEGADDQFAAHFKTFKDYTSATPGFNEVWTFEIAKTDYLVQYGDIMTGENGSRTVWIHANHQKDASVKYRTSVWRYRFDCKGYASLTAYSYYLADGTNLTSWDGNSTQAIRPETMLASLEWFLCK